MSVGARAREIAAAVRSGSQSARFAVGDALAAIDAAEGEVHAFTVSGKWGYLEYDWTAEAGDYIFEEVGTVHTLAVPEDAGEPAIIQFVIEQGMDFYDENDVVFHTEDPESIMALYFDALDRQGVPRPEGILP